MEVCAVILELFNVYKQIDGHTVWTERIYYVFRGVVKALVVKCRRPFSVIIGN
jgi:hypothetical protein